MVAINYGRLRARCQSQIDADPTTFEFYSRSSNWQATGKLAPAGSRTFGRTGQTFQLPGSEIVGRQMWVAELPYDTPVPHVDCEVRTDRQGVEQRFTVITTLPTPWKLEVILDESG